MLEQEEWEPSNATTPLPILQTSKATNPKMEAYVQQLIAQGYPEAQARVSMQCNLLIGLNDTLIEFDCRMGV